jgi:hypothetical protein
MPMAGVSQALLPEAFSQGLNFFSRPARDGVKEREKSLPSRLPRKESGGSKASEKMLVREHSIRVVKLQRAHGGCLGIRRL